MNNNAKQRFQFFSGVQQGVQVTVALLLGPGLTTFHPAAHAQSPLTDIAMVAVSGHHTCALTVGGGVKCWGDNRGGQLGDDTAND